VNNTSLWIRIFVCQQEVALRARARACCCCVVVYLLGVTGARGMASEVGSSGRRFSGQLEADLQGNVGEHHEY